MDDARQRTGEAGEGRDGLDAPIDRALDRMGGAGPIDVCAQVLARLDGAADAAGRWWAVWRPAAAVGGIALVVLLAPSRQGRRPPDTREASGKGHASAAGPSDKAAEAQRGAALFLPGAPAGLTGEPIPAMPPPPPILIPAIVPTPIADGPTVIDLGTAVGILPIVVPARGLRTPGRLEASAHEQAARRRLRPVLRHFLRRDDRDLPIRQRPTGRSGPAVQQGETAGVQTTPKETQAKPPGAQAKPDVPQAENTPIASGSLVNPANVRFDVTISYQTGTQAPVVRTAMLTVADGTGLVGRSASLRANNQVPVPNTTFLQAEKPDGSAAKPVTSYTYRSIGLNLDVRDVQVHANRVKAVLGVEFSAVDEPPAGSPLAPSFPTFQQTSRSCSRTASRSWSRSRASNRQGRARAEARDQGHHPEVAAGRGRHQPAMRRATVRPPRRPNTGRRRTGDGGAEQALVMLVTPLPARGAGR